MVDLFHPARRRTTMADANLPTATPTETRCARCRAALSESDRVTAEDRVFCRTCYDILKLELRRSVATMSEDINYALIQRGESWRVTFPPASLDMFYRIVAVNFGIMKLVFLGIVAYEAWIIPRPVKLPQP